MAQIVLGIATLLALHSLGLIIASLVTNKWYTDSKKDIGVYGICEHLQMINNFNETYYYYRNKYSYTTSNNRTMASINNGSVTISSSRERFTSPSGSRFSPVVGQKRLFKKRRNNIFLITDDNGNNNHNNNNSPPSAAMMSNERQPSNSSHNDSNHQSGVVKKSTTNNTKCYQLIWPDSQQAYQYLTVKTSYKLTLMGVSICSVSFAVLTSVWSVVCAIFVKIGSNVRSNEVLIGLSIITDLITILTFLLFLCKDDRIHHIEYYGYSFWFSVAASVGYFLTSILYILNRINLRFMYMLRNYDQQSSKSLN